MPLAIYSFLKAANPLALYKGLCHLPSINRPLEFLKISATSGCTVKQETEEKQIRLGVKEQDQWAKGLTQF